MMAMNELLEMSHYDFELPEKQIAKTPLLPKKNAKLLVYNRHKDSITHTYFRNFSHFLPKNTLLVFNDTKVIKARFYGQKFMPQSPTPFGKNIEGLFHRIENNDTFIAQFRGKLKPNDWVIVGDKILLILESLQDGLKKVQAYKYNQTPTCPISSAEFLESLESFGHVPIPPYLKRNDTQEDTKTYQSVFAKTPGAIAAPTASLHFTKTDMHFLKTHFKTAFITLHVGAGTFKPIVVENAREHKMHQEIFNIPPYTLRRLKKSHHITAIGTTVTRTLEFYHRTLKTHGECDIFLHPLNPPHYINALLTNFHLPKSTLIMLVAGFIGQGMRGVKKMQEIYQIAKDKNYRFYSYGDGMLII